MEQGKLMIQYGLAGAALAMYRTAHAQNRKAIKALLISGSAYGDYWRRQRTD